MSPLPVVSLRGLDAYKAQAVPAPDLLRLDGSEGTRPVVRPGEMSVDWSLRSRRYPDPGELAEALAKRYELSVERIVVGAGADELLDRCCRAFLDAERAMILPVPAFAMFGHYARLAGAQVIEVPWTAERFPTDAVVKAIDARTGVIVCTSPNNPTGAVLFERELRRVSEAAPDALVLLDHAYIEYAPGMDLTRAAADLPNVCVVRTFSKAWGLAGIRVGWACASLEVANVLRAAGGPYPVAGPSLALALARLESGATEVERHVAAVIDRRARLLALAGELHLPALATQANFVCLEAAARAPFLFEALLAQGILARTFDAAPGTLRLAIPEDEEAFSRLAEALRVALAPEALLFDLDGVLADVSQSQRVCVRETVASFGVEVTAQAVSEMFLAGDANDDWVVTHRLLAQEGRDIPFAAVRERYQSLYLGGPARPGLREREKRLVEPAFLAALARRLPLAIVTGRPRAEADWFLEHYGFDGLFSTVVAAEDAARKPDAAPTRLALRRLGVRRAWMVGDTPDDIESARAAGVLPVGVVSPADDPDRARRRLTEAGAAFTLEKTEDLGQWLQYPR